MNKIISVLKWKGDNFAELCSFCREVPAPSALCAGAYVCGHYALYVNAEDKFVFNHGHDQLAVGDYIGEMNGLRNGMFIALPASLFEEAVEERYIQYRDCCFGEGYHAVQITGQVGGPKDREDQFVAWQYNSVILDASLISFVGSDIASGLNSFPPECVSKSFRVWSEGASSESCLKPFILTAEQFEVFRLLVSEYNFVHGKHTKGLELIHPAVVLPGEVYIDDFGIPYTYSTIGKSDRKYFKVKVSC